MTPLYFFVGLCLGSLGGFLIALLVVHGRAQSLAEEMLAQRDAESPAERAWGRVPPGDAVTPQQWGYARPHRPLQGLGMD